MGVSGTIAKNGDFLSAVKTFSKNHHPTGYDESNVYLIEKELKEINDKVANLESQISNQNSQKNNNLDESSLSNKSPDSHKNQKQDDCISHDQIMSIISKYSEVDSINASINKISARIPQNINTNELHLYIDIIQQCLAEADNEVDSNDRKNDEEYEERLEENTAIANGEKSPNGEDGNYIKGEDGNYYLKNLELNKIAREPEEIQDNKFVLNEIKKQFDEKDERINKMLEEISLCNGKVSSLESEKESSASNYMLNILKESKIVESLQNNSAQDVSSNITHVNISSPSEAISLG